MTNKELVKKEFALDRKRKEYQELITLAESGGDISEGDRYSAEMGLEMVTEELRQVQKKLYGWRHVAEQYDGYKCFSEVEAESIRRRILDLETQEAVHQGVLSNHSKDLKRAKDKLDTLRSHLGRNVGHIPKIEEIEEAQAHLLEVNRKAQIANLALPRIRQELEDLRRELDKLDSRKKSKGHKNDVVYATPDEEVHARAKLYAKKHNCSYAKGVDVVIAEDPDLAEAYLYGKY